jgi:prepilin-type N-terminal cleavage/methylation domain-containing protein
VSHADRGLDPSSGNSSAHARGFTLIEVLIALALFVVIAVSVAQLVGVATNAMWTSREHTTAVILAAAKMDQLRALAWTYEPEQAGLPAVARTDLTTNLSEPGHPGNGPGLSASPADALERTVPGYVDYLDDSGRWVGNDLVPPRDAVFIRRWVVNPLPADPERTLILQVRVTTVKLDRMRGARPWNGRTGSEALLVSVRTRMGS